MLQIQNICKEYKTGGLVQKALDHVHLNLRENEFVAILGPSGSGKTTLLNVIGGLDRYDSGDLIINGISTKKYQDRDWDSYRNHTIGFVFQSYNLIPHQTVLANVELALTISGIGKEERRRRAIEALQQVGLGEQLHKKPSQMSGGQMQRVAIARALVNDPEILLADEPTGALDSDTSVQVMELLQEVAKNRLVVMVTHNPELAQEYATRIVTLRDGKICADSNPYEVNMEEIEEPEHRNMGKASMSFLTALSLSFHNLQTKKARTLLTSFAGSIGIIGIALILSLSTGVNAYIKTIEKDTLSEYPLQIQSTGFDMTSMFVGVSDEEEEQDGEIEVLQMVTDMFSTMNSNDLASLKAYLESGSSEIKKYTNAIEYTYQVTPQIYRESEDGIRQVHPDQSFEALGLGSSSASNSMMSAMMSTDVFYEMPENTQLYESQYEVKAGRWPENYQECVVVLSSGGSISDFMLYTLGLRDAMELDEMVQQFIEEEEIEVPEDSKVYDYDDFLGKSFKLVNSSDYYEYDGEYQVWKDKTENQAYMKELVAKGEDLTIVGVVQPAEGMKASALSMGIGYPSSLTKHVAEEAEQSEIVKQQLEKQNIDVFTNEAFGEEKEENTLNMESLFRVNTDKIRNAFQWNTSALDFSGMLNFDGIQLDVPNLPSLSLGELLSKLDVSVSASGMESMAGSLLEGYQLYAEQNPQADYSNLGEHFLAYLDTEDAKGIFDQHMRELIQSNGGIVVETDQMMQMFQALMLGYQEYIAQQGYENPEMFDEYFLEYIGTNQAQALIQQFAEEIFQLSDDFQISQEQLRSLSENLIAGYQVYASQNGLPDPTKIGDSFVTYLNTQDGSQRLRNGIAEVIDLNQLDAQLSTAMAGYMSEFSQVLETQIVSAMSQAMGQLGTQLQQELSNAMQFDTKAFAEAFEMNMDAEEFMELMMSIGSSKQASYDGNLKKLGYVDFDEPSGIALYPMDFESKEQVVRILDDYNQKMEEEGKEEQVITYTDVVGTLMSSVTDIIDVISYVLIAFVAISLIVSSIMIGVITYISVLERKKEIGILRAIGTSKGNISQVFNAETFIIGFCAGILGIGITLLLLIPGNALIHFLAGTDSVNAVLPVGAAVVLVLISVILTLLGGIIPSRKAAKSDPVAALRSE